jgi:hypothetical protein
LFAKSRLVLSAASIENSTCMPHISNSKIFILEKMFCFSKYYLKIQPIELSFEVQVWFAGGPGE